LIKSASSFLPSTTTPTPTPSPTNLHQIIMAFESQIRTILQRFLEIPCTKYPDWTWQDVLAVIERHRRAVTPAERFSTANNPDFFQYRAEFQTWRNLCKCPRSLRIRISPLIA
jgi:hypothetical protein